MGVEVRDDDTPGDVVISWNAVAAANYYRVGWVAYPDYLEITGAGRPWDEAFAFVDVENIGQTSRTVRRLTPGVLYAFRVGSKDAKDGAASYGEWVRFTVQADAAACPVAEPIADAPVNGDYDTDNDGLIEIRNIDQLDAIRYDLDGDGASDDSAYAAAFPNAVANMGCPSDGCAGYELVADLDFGSVVSAYGWEPIGWWNSSREYDVFNATFDGNGHTIANLYISRGNADNVGLFGVTGWDSVIRGVRLATANVVGNAEVGGLVGSNGGAISDSHVTGVVTGAGNYVGGLVGWNYGSITGSYAANRVTGIGSNVGGLVGQHNKGEISASYATGAVTGGSRVGGLVGDLHEGGAVTVSYATGSVSAGDNRAGGLIGYLHGDGTVTASYATGSVSAYIAGGLVGDGNGTITASYATGAVSGRSIIGGLYSGNFPNITVIDSYWDTETSGLTTGDEGDGEGKTTAELQTPTGATGIYAIWNPNWWDFGTSEQYPVLKVDGLSVAAQRP